MLRSFHTHSRRPGVILLVVVIMLALFAVIGLSFVLYAESQATHSRIYREAQQPAEPPLPSELLLSWALGQLIYDCSDKAPPAAPASGDGFDVTSAMRGNSLARAMYGLNTSTATRLANEINNNVVAFNGHGPIGTAHAGIVNYQYFLNDGFVRDPERMLSGPNSASRNSPADPFPADSYVYPFNAPYTYPDRNNMALAAVNADGQVLVPSFYRPWLSGPLSLSPDASNYNKWYEADPNLKYQVLRPRPAEMYYNPANQDTINAAGNYVKGDPHNFPLPFNGGDVKNLAGAPGGNDSFWMDLGFPVMGKNSRSGRKYKPLFAFLIVDLDGRVNVNVHGNTKGRDPTNPLTYFNDTAVARVGHVSNQGLGRHEVDLSKVFTSNLKATSPFEWTQLLAGMRVVGSTANAGRYGTDSLPGVGAEYPPPSPDSRLSYLFPIDFDGTNESASSAPFQTTRFKLPAVNAFNTYPGFAAADGYGNMTPAATTTANERAFHPLTYNVLLPVGDQPFGIDNMFYLIGKYQSTTNDYQLSNLYTSGLIQDNFNDPTPTALGTPLGRRIRNLITTHSYDLDTPGATAWVTDSSVEGQYSWPAAGLYPSGTAFSDLFATPSAFPPASLLNGDFAGVPFPNGQPSADRRVPVLGRLDLNRKLNSYFTAGTFDPSKYQQALVERQQFAKDVYDRLLMAATGVRPGSTAAPPAAGTPEFDARRWLAQLAVNIVDYIDDDDFSTPFIWNPNDPTNPNDPANYDASQVALRMVYGTEAPKLVINEAYAEIRNDPADNDPVQGAQKPFKVNFWIELLNPHNKAMDANGEVIDPNIVSSSGPVNRAAVQLQRGSYGVYQILVAALSDNVAGAPPQNTLEQELANRANPGGDILPGGPVLSGTPPGVIKLRVNDFNPADGPGAGYDKAIVQPANGAFSDTTNRNQGFFVIAPKTGEGDFAVGTTPQASLRIATGTTPSPAGGVNGLSFDLPQTQQPTDVSGKQHAIILQRLLCPLLPPNPAPGSALDPNSPYNPYVTVDVMSRLAVNDAVQYLPNPAAPTPAPPRPEYQQPHVAYGRPQPFAAIASLLQPQTKIAPPMPTGEPQTTFFQHNSSGPIGTPPTTTSPRLTMPFDWLVHLDRALTSPMELTHVSAVPPYQLTQKFIVPQSASTSLTKFRHTAPWMPVALNDPALGLQTLYNSGDVRLARIYRALEYFTVGDRSLPSATGGRLPGMVNINTIWDVETFRALCSAYPDNLVSPPDGHFIEKHVETLWNEILKLRTPGLKVVPGQEPSSANGFRFVSPPPNTAGFGLAQSDRPFWSFASAVGEPELTALRTSDFGSGGTKPAFHPQPTGAADDVGQHPYLLNEVLAKIAPHITTRSNVFAVYLTVGFFEVMDDSTIPPKLGAEIQTLSGTDVAKNFTRRRMFAIVDRTNLALDNPSNASDANFRLRQSAMQPYHLSSSVSIPDPPPPFVDIPVPAATGFLNGGTVMTIQYEGNQFPIHSVAEGGVVSATRLWIDIGGRQEMVKVHSFDAIPPVNGIHTMRIALNGTNGVPGYTVSHAAGFRISNVQLGNPGPQGPIDYSSPQYKPVVPYTFIIE